MNNLRSAIIFLTRVPIRARREPSLNAAVPWFPIVGVVLGAIIGGVAAGLSDLVPATVAGCCAVLLGVVITGAFHEDGLADVADAFVGGWDPDQRLRILKDPLHGSYGVAALSGSILIRALAVGAIAPTSAANVVACLIAAHCLARASAVGLMLAAPLAGADDAGLSAGLGADYTRSLRRAPAIVGIAAAAAITAAVCGWWVGPFAAAALCAAIGIGWWARRKIGGISGDVLGACEQVGECLILIVASGLVAGRTVWWT